MAGIRVDRLIDDILQAASKAANKDITTLEGFSATQLRGLATQAAWIAAARASGELDDGLYEYFVGNLQRTAVNFTAVLRGLSDLVAEKVLNAVIKVLTKALFDAIGLGVG